jgi:hypothetical protein
MWYHWLELNNGLLSWNRFVVLVNARFGLPLIESLIGELALRHDSYCNKFMSLSCHDPVITENHIIQLYTAGLGHPLRTDVALQKLTSLDVASC